MKVNAQASEAQDVRGFMFVEVSAQGEGKAYFGIVDGDEGDTENAIWLTRRQTIAVRDKLTEIIDAVEENDFEDVEDRPEIEED